VLQLLTFTAALGARALHLLLRKKKSTSAMIYFNCQTKKKITNNLVKDGKNIVDSRQVSKEASHFDFAALAQGDFSSLAGTWQDANGFTFEFSPEGIVSENGRLTLSDLAYDDKGEAISQVSSQRDGGFILYYYAAGNQIPYWHFSIADSDPSDYGVIVFLPHNSAVSTTNQRNNS